MDNQKSYLNTSSKEGEMHRHKDTLNLGDAALFPELKQPDIITLGGDDKLDCIALHGSTNLRKSDEFKKDKKQNRVEQNTENKEPTDHTSNEDEKSNFNEDIKSLSFNHSSVYNRNLDTSFDFDSGINVSPKSSVYSSSVTESCVNEDVQNKLKELMKKHPQGIWCCDLPDLYNEYYKVPLEFNEYGYHSLIEMVKSLKEIFRCVRPSSGDWLLYDATKPPSQEEQEMFLKSYCNLPEEVENNILELLEFHCRINNKHGIYADDLLTFYYKRYQVKLELNKYGFPNIKALINKLNGKILKYETEGMRILLKPLTEKPELKDIGVFSVTPDDHLFDEFFPVDCVRLGEKFTEINLEEYFEIGRSTEVIIGDVWSPDKFYIQLRKFGNDLKHVMGEMQKFYNMNTNKYKMPEATVRLGQICVALYITEESKEWHRSIITEMENKDSVVASFIDYGMKAVVEKRHLRFMHRDFFQLPAQGIAAKMMNIKPAREPEWSLTACKRFFALVCLPLAQIYVTDIDFENRTVTGEITTKDGVNRLNVNSKLVAENLAMFVKQYSENHSVDAAGVVSAVGKDQHSAESSVDEEESVSNSVVENPATEPTSFSEEGKKNFQVPAFEKTGSLCDNNNTNLHTRNLGILRFPASSAQKPTVSVSPRSTAPYPSDSYNMNTGFYGRNRALWTLEKEIEATAFCLLNKNEWIRVTARENLENGLKEARSLAEKLVYTNCLTYKIM